MAKITEGEKAAMDSVRLLFGKSPRDTKEFFESLGIYAVLNYSKREKIIIPFIGEVEISYAGEEVTENGRAAKIETAFSPSPFLVKNAGQIQDKEITEAEKILAGRFRAVFKERVK